MTGPVATSRAAPHQTAAAREPAAMFLLRRRRAGRARFAARLIAGNANLSRAFRQPKTRAQAEVPAKLTLNRETHIASRISPRDRGKDARRVSPAKSACPQS